MDGDTTVPILLPPTCCKPGDKQPLQAGIQLRSALSPLYGNVVYKQRGSKAFLLINVCVRLVEMVQHFVVSIRKETEDCVEAVALFIMLDRV